MQLIKDIYIKVGTEFVNISALSTFKFVSDLDGYITMLCTPAMCPWEYLQVPISNKNELAEVWLQLDEIIDYRPFGTSLTKIIDSIDEIGRDPSLKRQRKRPSKRPYGKKFNSSTNGVSSK